MIPLGDNISRIEALLLSDVPLSDVYAALECRAAVEMICYDRLATAYRYTSFEDLRDWRPAKVMRFLEEEVDEHIWRGMTLSWNKEPVGPNSAPKLSEIEYEEIGTQSHIEVRDFTKCWYKLSSFLHANFPTVEKGKTNFGQRDDIEPTVREALALLKKYAEGTLTSVHVWGMVRFTCCCGSENRRSEKAMIDGKVISCISSECQEKYIVRKEGNEIYFQRCIIEVDCKKCRKTHTFPQHVFSLMDVDQAYLFQCLECDEENAVKWSLVQKIN